MGWGVGGGEHSGVWEGEVVGGLAVASMGINGNRETNAASCQNSPCDIYTVVTIFVLGHVSSSALLGRKVGEVE